MFRNYFTVAWRSLVNNKAYSSLNLLGLAIGMAVALLVGLWVHYQFSFNRFFPENEKVYMAKVRYNDNGEIRVGPATNRPLENALRKEIPGIKYVAQTDWMGPHGLNVGEKKIYSDGAMAGPEFLQIMRYPLLKGNAADVLKEPYSIVLTASTAKSLFGDVDPINKMVNIDNSHDLKVTGILKDLPKNSTFKLNYIVPFAYYEKENGWVREAATSWNTHSFQTFIQLEDGVKAEQLAPQLELLYKKHYPRDYNAYKSAVILHGLTDLHLYSEFKNGKLSGGFIEYVRIFSIIGILVLLIACINFMNLSTARSEKRAKEVGIRKAIGSKKRDLIIQFLIESVLMASFAAALAVFLVQGVLPAFNTLTRADISIPYSSAGFWVLMIGYVLFTGLLSGGRPAFYLSSFQPIKVLKGTLNAGRQASIPRKVLVVLQFTCSIALIITTVIVYQQLQHAKKRPSGYVADKLMMSDVSNDISRNYSALKNALLQSGVVSDVTLSSSPATEIYSNNDISHWPDKRPDETLGLATIGIGDADYFKTMGMSFAAGGNFSGNLAADTLNAILNEAAVKRMRLKDPLNQTIALQDGRQKLRIIGVVKDALMRSPFAPAEPSLFLYTPGWAGAITYRLSGTVPASTAIEKLRPIFAKFNPAYPFLYKFVDEQYAAKFSLETLIGKLSALFASLAIFISCLGLFGLAAYTAEQRNKEIGIRKVLGATVSQVWVLLSKEFILLVGISCILASPIAYYFLQNWLEQYSYRIKIGPAVFIAAAAVAVLITVCTVSFQAIKAALTNPVKSLRSE